MPSEDPDDADDSPERRRESGERTDATAPGSDPTTTPDAGDGTASAGGGPESSADGGRQGDTSDHRTADAGDDHRTADAGDDHRTANAGDEGSTTDSAVAPSSAGTTSASTGTAPSSADTTPPSAGTAPPSPGGDAVADDRDGPDGPLDVVREVLSSVGIVLLIGALLFGASGVWPPLVAVESGSMEPHMFRGDLVFVAEEGRYAPDTAVAGVVTYQQGEETGYRSFGAYGNVIVFQPDGRQGTPIIHRARLYVEEGENWVERANPAYLGDSQTCAEIVTCPAPHDGFITRGDGNPRYDQVGRSRDATLSTVVKPEWVRGNAKARVPKLGCVRLELSGIGCDWPLIG